MPLMPYQLSEMPVRVPGERGDAVAELEAVALQPLRHLQRPRPRLRVCRAHDRPLHRACHDLAIAVLGGGVVEHLVAKQWPLLHQTEHVFLHLWHFRCRRASGRPKHLRLLPRVCVPLRGMSSARSPQLRHNWDNVRVDLISGREFGVSACPRLEDPARRFGCVLSSGGA